MFVTLLSFCKSVSLYVRFRPLPRNLVECFFNKLKQFPAIATTRYDRRQDFHCQRSARCVTNHAGDVLGPLFHEDPAEIVRYVADNVKFITLFIVLYPSNKRQIQVKHDIAMSQIKGSHQWIDNNVLPRSLSAKH
jgi:hypothetical protein